MKLSFVLCLEHLESIKDEWVEVFNDSYTKSPLLSHEFLKLWYDCFLVSDQIRIYRATDHGQTIGFLPLVLRRKNCIRILASLTNDHCFHSDPLVRRGYEDVFPKLILKELLQDSDTWDVFQHNFSYSFSQFPGLFSDDLLDNSCVRWERRTQPTYTVFLNKSFDRYFHSDLTSKMRKNIKMYKNRIAKAGSGSFVHYQGADAVRLWPEFVRIENLGWKGDAGSSIRSIDSNFQRYYEGLINILADREALNMYFLQIDGKNIAGGFGYIEQDTFHYAKNGYDEQFKKFSPSNLLLLYIVEHLKSHFPDVKVFHMFPWDYGYKHRFANGETYCMETILYSQTIGGKALQHFSTLKKTAKKFLRKAKRGFDEQPQELKG